MRLLDKLAINRGLAILIGIVLSLVKILIPRIKKDLENNNPIPPLVPPPIKRKGRKKK